jgi:hypothetical protein
MHNIHDIKPICGQNIFISKMQCLMGYPKYKILSCKLTQKWHMSYAIVGKGFLPWHPLTVISPTWLGESQVD